MISKARCLHAICVSQFELGKLHDTNEDVVLCYEAIFALHCFNMSQQMTRLSFTRYNWGNFRCFSLYMGW